MKSYKKILFALSAMIILSACANVEKMVDQGNYEDAIRVATKRLSVKKNKKDKYVRAAEEAFAKVTKRDMDRISVLKKRNGLDDWKKIHAITENMLDRQEKIQPLLPLIAKEGYHADFNFVRAEVIRAEAADIVSRSLYDEGMRALASARQTESKFAARDAYAFFRDLDNYKSNFRDSRVRMAEAEELGIAHVLIKIENRSYSIMPIGMERDLLSFYNTGRQTQWKKFHVNSANAPRIDFVSNIVVRDISVSPESVRETIHNFVRPINETQILRDQNGIIQKDSLGNNIEIVVTRNVRAEVFEISQSKQATVDMVLEIMSADDSRVIRRERISESVVFQNDACRIRGDRRAVEGRWLELGQPIRFPSDSDMILDVVDELKSEMTTYLRRFPFEDALS